MLCALPRYQEYSRKTANGLKPAQLLELECGQVFHGHMTMSAELMKNIRELEIAAVYVYRDLRDAIVSDYFHKSKLNPDRATDFFRANDKNTLFMAENLEKWCGPARRYQDVRKWLAEPAIPKVTYEALKANPLDEMGRVLREMGFDASEEIVAYIVAVGSFENMSGGRSVGEEDAASGRRKGIVGDWRNHFTEDHIRSFKERYGHLLIEYGYEKDNSW